MKNKTDKLLSKFLMIPAALIRPKERQTRKIPLSLAYEIINNDIEDGAYEVLDNVLSYSSRWTDSYYCIFTDTNYPDQFWSIEYVKGRTEDVYMDNEDTFPSLKNWEVSVIEVYPVQKVITVYE